ncbi:hypothetical protein I6E17_03590 [Fusobacterium perfoetens]|uniref:hypothetical protein n=1 Tax=Fusobacterium perfoetens TaxID=852 RepID=UPI001F36B07E|nr:hypothetical protein [Fusobacterium perfoetens]MCF2625263.1 hypothetical protein [Fusobacterium perfoetens]
MANEDYKNGKLVEIVREFNHKQGTTKYEINGITQSIAVPFWREEEGKFKVIPKGSYKFINESGNNYLEITDETILQQVSQFQIVYIYSQISSTYFEDFPEISVLTTKYNELVEDTTKLFNYLKSTGMIADTLQMTKVLSQLEPLTTWYMDEQGEIRALPISDLYVKFQQMIDTLYKEIKALLMIDYNDMSNKLSQQTTASLKQLADKTVELKNDLQAFADGLEREKKALIDDYVEKTSKKTIDTYVENTTKPSINNYIEVTTKPSIKSYVDTVSKPEIDKYIAGTSKPSIDDYVKTVSKPDIDSHVSSKKTEITTHTGNEIKRVTAEGEKQLEIIVGAGGGLATRVDDLESDNATNKQNITVLESNKLNKGTVSPEYDTAKKIEDKIVNLKSDKLSKGNVTTSNDTAEKIEKNLNDLTKKNEEFFIFSSNYKGEYNESTSYNIGDVVMVKGHEPCYVFETINPEMSDPRSIMMFKKVYRIEDKMYYTKQKDGWEIIFPKEEGVSFYTIPQKGTEQQYFSTVDNYFPYSKIGRVLLKNGVEQYECDFNDSTKKKGGGTANLTGTDGDVMVRIPKFYSEVKYVPQGIRYRIFSYENPTKKIALGIKPHPYFLKPDGKTYYDVRYQGAYKASLKDGVLRSISGVSPLVSKTMANFIDYAQQGRTNDYSIGNFVWKSVQFMLYIVEFGNLNSQELFGQGRSNTSSLSATGTTNTLGNRSGRISADDANGNASYRGLEDFIGNIWEFDAGFFATNDGYYITNNPAYYLNKANMTHYNVNLTVDKGDNFISEIERIEGAEYLVLPKTLKGSATTYYCDQLWSHNPGQENISLSGGSWDDGSRCGVLCLGWHLVASYANAHFGARLSYARK